MSQFAPEDSQGNIDFVSDGDVTFESDRNQDGVGDLVFRTAGVERARIAHDGTGTGWANVLGGSITPVFNVKTGYGAKGDGVTSDTTAITNAIAAANAAGGGLVYFPTGTYIFDGSSVISTTAAVTLVGDGPSSIISFTGGSNGYLQLNGAKSGVQDLTLQRASATPSRLLRVQQANCSVRRVYFAGQGGTYAGNALNLSGADGCTVSECVFDTVNGFAVSANACNYLRIRGNRVLGHLGSQAIYLNTSIADFVIADNVIVCDATLTQAAIGCYTAAASTFIQRGSITGNTIEAGSSAIVVQKTSSGDHPIAITITGNAIKLLAASASGSGISVSSVDNVTVTGNTINSNSFSYAQGIEATTVTSATITGNVVLCTGTTPIGILVNETSHSTVTGNTIRDMKDASGSYGIKAYAAGGAGATDNTITGNHVFFLAGGSASGKGGIAIISNNSSGHADRNVVVGNSVYGDGVTTSYGVLLQAVTGSVDRNLVGMNVLRNVTTAVGQSSDTNSLLSGTTWNLS